MLLSIIIPTYNNEATIQRCLASAEIEKHMNDVEFVIISDGCTDLTTHRIKEWCRNNNILHANLRIFYQKHLGASSARNLGLREAFGDYVWFVDADDTLAPGALDLALPLLTPDIDLLKLGNLTDAYTDRILGKSSTLDHTTYIYRRKFLYDHFISYPEWMSILEDSLFVLRCIQENPRVSNHQELKLYQLWGRNNSTRGAWKDDRVRHYLGDITYFFHEFRLYAYTRGNEEKRLYDRYLYVYLRVLAVKGIPWSMMESFRGSAALPSTFYYTNSPNMSMWLLSRPFTHRVITLACRILRKKC